LGEEKLKLLVDIFKEGELFWGETAEGEEGWKKRGSEKLYKRRFV
jgi:hypothetical protein